MSSEDVEGVQDMGGAQDWGGGELGGSIWFIPTGEQRETSERVHCQERQHGEDGLEGEDGQLVRKGTRSLSPISLDPSDGAGRWVGCGRKQAPGAVMLVELSVCLSPAYLPSPLLLGMPPASFRERQSLSWVLWAAVALRLVPRQWLSRDASMAPRMDALEGQPRGQGHSCKRALWPPQRAPLGSTRPRRRAAHGGLAPYTGPALPRPGRGTRTWALTRP